MSELFKIDIPHGSQPDVCTPPEHPIDPDKRLEKLQESIEAGSERKDSSMKLPRFDPDVRPDAVATNLADLGPIADVQYGGTCWAEAIENIIQLMRGDTEGRLNNLSTDIIAKVAAAPEMWDAIINPNAETATDLWNIPPARYADMLKEYGVNAESRPFSHEELQDALKEHRPVIIGGDVKCLGEPYNQGEEGGHALVAVGWDPVDKIYTLLDSNFDKVYKVPPVALMRFATGTPEDRVANLLVGNMTVVTDRAAWPNWNEYGADGKWHTFVNNWKTLDPFEDFKKFTGEKA